MNDCFTPLEQIPHITLVDGNTIPAIGLGTFGSDAISAYEIQQAVEFAIRIGYRHIDCASVYGNEKEIGSVLTKLQQENIVKREDLWITSKVWNDMHNEVERSCCQSLQDLQLDYLDLYLVHWPFPNHHAKGVAQDSRSPNAKPYIHEAYMKTWEQMECLQKKGLVRYIGCSNMSIAKLELLLRDSNTKPAFNEIELHPHFQQSELFDYIQQKGIMPIAYSPIGSPGRPGRDRMPEDTIDTEDPVVINIGQKNNLHPVQVCLKWAIQRGQIPIPFSAKKNNIYANLKASTLPPLSNEDMAALAQIDKNCRLIKGQVFLWRENQDWQDLWDIDGVIQQ